VPARPIRWRATRLVVKTRHIRARLAELQAAAAKASEVTVESLLAELEDAREKATTKDQLSAAVRAIEAKAKISGLLTQKVEIVDPAQAFDNAETPEQIAAVLARGIAKDRGYKLTPDELRGFTELMVQWVAALDHYLSGCPAKPVQPAISAHDMEIIDRRTLGLRQIGNGNHR
jgi:pyruvate/2-oxoglutarate dehydrogenase complex dihydrolipoamide acyltransferase (E2) component